MQPNPLALALDSMQHNVRSRLALLSLLTLGACGGGGGGGGGGPTSPPAAPTPFTALAGIVGTAAGTSAVRVDFQTPEAGFEVAAFVSVNPANLFATAPRVPGAGNAFVVVGGLAGGTRHFVGLGIRPNGGGAFTPIGPVTTATTRAPIFVDVAAAGGNGTSPAQAFNSLQAAVAAAQAAGGGNVWVKGGTYGLAGSMTVTAGVHLYGGFGPAFDLATRDPAATPTTVNVPAGVDGIVVGDKLSNDLASVLDGLRLDGQRRGRVGIDMDSTDPCDLELRGVIVTGMTDRGIRIRNLNDSAFDVVVTGCQSSENGADGLSVNGAWDFTVSNSTFANNGQEGFELDALVPQTGDKATLEIESCRFFGNAAEGLDCTLGTPLVPTNGEFSVRIRGSTFEENALDGCVVDSDFEAAAGYSAGVVLRECTARGNGGDGFALDLDGPLDTGERLTAFAHRLLASGNGGDGLHVTSESRPGIMTVSTSAFVGNAGAGLRADGPPAGAGNRAVVAGHCLFAGNGAAGVVSADVAAAASSSIAYFQANAFDASTLTVLDVASSNPAALAFANAPVEYARVTSVSGAVLTLAAASSFTLADVLELADDTVSRTALSISGGGTVVTLADAPTGFRVPGLLAAFQAGAPDVAEDYTLQGGSIALGAGMNGLDAGPLGSAAPGRPGIADAIAPAIFHVEATAPDIAQTVGASQTITVDFSGNLLGASANGTTVQAFRGAAGIGVTLSTSGARLTIDPVGGNWGAGDFRIELDGLTDTAGTPLSGAVVLPFQR